MKRNYKLQITNYKQCTCLKKRQVPYNKIQITNKKTKGGYCLLKDSSRLQTMTAFNQKLLRGDQGGGFLEKSPPGKEINDE